MEKKVKTQRIMITNNKAQACSVKLAKISPIHTHDAGELLVNARVLLNVTFLFRASYFRQMKRNDGGISMTVLFSTLS